MSQPIKNKQLKKRILGRDEKLKPLYKRILQISYDLKLGHIGSCITALPIIREIYDTKKPDEPFILSSGHAGLSLYTVIEETEKVNAEKIFAHHGVHPDRCTQCHLYCSTGSLGHGLPIALGMALADRSKNVYCLISDGEFAEGSIHEALRIIREQKLDNLQVYMNNNGYAAYRQTDLGVFPSFIQIRNTNMSGWPSYLQGLQAHYKVLNEAEYNECLEVLK